MGFRAWRMGVLLALGAGLGLAWNGASGRGFALSSNVFVRPGDEVIQAAEAKARLDKGALFLDARPADFYNMEHVPGALSLPEPDFDKAFAALEPTLRSHFDIVVYCAGYGCEASHIVAGKLKQKGIQAAILNEGWPAWLEARYPTRTGDKP